VSDIIIIDNEEENKYSEEGCFKEEGYFVKTRISKPGPVHSNKKKNNQPIQINNKHRY
jgi:hypothetical protein